MLAPPNSPGRLRRPPVGLERGDILLRSPLRPSPKQRGIVAVQRLVYAQQHAQFTHVGIYVGKGVVVDATPEHGVAARDCSNYFDGAWVRARRLRVSRAARLEVALEAMRWAAANRPYGTIAAAAAAFSAVGRPPPGSAWELLFCRLVEKERTKLGRRSSYSCAYCGNLVDDIAAAAANRSIINQIDCHAALPAAFSADAATYDDVQLHW